MEGFSVINFDNFKKYQESFTYGTTVMFSRKINFSSKNFEETISKDHPAYEDLVAFTEM